MFWTIIAIATVIIQIINGVSVYNDTKILRVVQWYEFWIQYSIAMLGLICILLSYIGD